MKNRPQAKDVDELEVLRFIDQMSVERWPEGDPLDFPTRWVMVWDFELALEQGAFGGLPIKVIIAKIEKLIRRGFLTGCTCGCRGDFELTDKGIAVLDFHDDSREVKDMEPMWQPGDTLTVNYTSYTLTEK